MQVAPRSDPSDRGMTVHRLLWLLLVLSVPSALPHRPRRHAIGNGGKCREPVVEVTVSPLVSKKKMRVLDIEWEVEGWKKGDRVGLVEGGPSGAAPLFTAPATAPSGWVRTDVQEASSHGDKPVFNRTCTKYWAVYWRANESRPVASSCLGTQPRWMEESRDAIKHLQLKDVFLPGTHDSASFILSSKPFSENRYQKYVYTQRW